MASRQIYITEKDKIKLKKLIGDLMMRDIDAKSYVGKLETELDIAEELPEEKLPEDVVAMNSTARIVMGDLEEEVTLVYPDEADVAQNKISVLSPIGTAI